MLPLTKAPFRLLQQLLRGLFGRRSENPAEISLFLFSNAVKNNIISLG